jgi:hypothetical protein
MVPDQEHWFRDFFTLIFGWIAKMFLKYILIFTKKIILQLSKWASAKT